MTGPLDELDVRHYGDPDLYRGGVAPPCDVCGRREADERVDDVLGSPFADLCRECLEDLEDAGVDVDGGDQV